MREENRGMLDGIEAVIFDLDGTLVDSMWMWKDIDREYLGRYSLELPPDLQNEIEGMSYTETARYFQARFRIPRTLDQIKKDWEEMAFEKYTRQVPLKPGAGTFLKEIKKRGIRTGIATSNGKGLVEAVTRVHGLDQSIDSIRTACEVDHGKPAPDIYLMVAHDVGVDPCRCLVFEDIPMGILAGKNAGMKVCAVADPFSEDRLEQKKQLADYYITGFDDVLKNTYEVL